MKLPRIGRRSGAVLSALSALAVSTTLAACGGGDSSGGGASGAASKSSGGTATVNVAVIQGTQLFPVQVMQEKGFAAKHGIKLNVQAVAGPEALYTRAQTPDFQVGFGAWAKIAQLRDKGAHLTNAFSMYGYTNDVMVKKDSPIKSFADLKGKDIGLFGGPGAGTTLMFRLEAKRFFGFDPNTDTKVHYGAPPLLLGQLQRGDLDAVLLLDPFIDKMLASGQYRSIGNLGDIWRQKTGETPMLVSVTFNTDWAQQNPDAAKGFVAAFDEAQRYIKSHADVWPSLAGKVGVSGKAVDLMRKRVGPALLDTWDQGFIDQQLHFADSLKSTFGASGDFPQSIPDGTFTTEYAPGS